MGPDPAPAPSTFWRRECTACGACCAAPDISALDKPLGVPCRHLRPEQAGQCLCDRYETRPAVCRSYVPDWVCREVAPLPDLGARVHRFLELYGLLGELSGSARR